MRWAWAFPLILPLARSCSEADAACEDESPSSFLQTERLVYREMNASGDVVLSPPDVFGYAAPRESIREEAAATKQISTATMVGIGAALLVAMVALNCALGSRSAEDVSKHIAQDDKAPQRWRTFMAVMSLSIYLLSYADRYNISVAIIELAQQNGYTKKTQGFIQSAVYIGLLPGAVGMGKLASPDACGPHRTLVMSCAFWSLCTLLTPICADRSLGLLILVRILLGVGEAGCGPCVFQISSTWFPRHQQGQAIAMANAGQCLGAAIAMTFSGITERDWRIMFYVFGSVGLLWCCAFGLYGADSPAKHRFISDEERISIQTIKRIESPVDKPMPYAHILRHRAVWGLMCMESMAAFIWYFWLSWMPSFFHDNFNMPTGESGTMGLIAYWLAAPAALSWAEISAQCYRSGRFSLRQCRLCMAGVSVVASALPTLILILIYQHSRAEFSVGLVVIIVVLLSAKGVGHSPNVVELGGPANSSRLGGLLTIFSASVGVVGNVLIGYLLNTPSLGWTAALILTIGAGVLGFSVFAMNLQVKPVPPPT